MVSISRQRLAAFAVLALTISLPSQSVSSNTEVPSWLQRFVGTAEGQIAPVVLQRARALYQRKVREGVVSNACYFAMDATRPNSIGGKPGRRFYTICESQRTFRAVSSGHGNGRKLRRVNFKNGRQCATNFSNAEGSNLTAGGSYVTAEIRQSFKGYHAQSGQNVPFVRPFLIFDGEGETINARERDIGGHQAVFLRAKCRYLNPTSPHADDQGYVPFGELVNYTGGRSNGCTTWSPAASTTIITQVQNNPTTLYIYPESKDVNAVAEAVQSGKPLSRDGLYWNDACLDQIGAPKFWPKQDLQPIINAWRQSLPYRRVQPLPICG
ncbi:MAG: hypothetical protein AAFQ21_12185 [Pseudomonadota bacterium]